MSRSFFHLAGPALISLIFAAHAGAGETRLGVDRNKDIDELIRTGEVSVRTTENDGVYRTDASAVLNADFATLYRASADYDRYVEMGMPYLRASVVLDRTGDILHTWNWMKLKKGPFSQTSKHCYEVRLHAALPTDAAGSQWELHPCRGATPRRIPSRHRDDYEDDPAFSRMEGSWYMKRLADAPDGTPRIYVRYFFEAVFDTGIPDFIVRWVARRQLTDGVREVIHTLAKESAVE